MDFTCHPETAGVFGHCGALIRGQVRCLIDGTNPPVAGLALRQSQHPVARQFGRGLALTLTILGRETQY